MDKDTPHAQIVSSEDKTAYPQPDLTQLQSHVINDGEVHTTETSTSEELESPCSDYLGDTQPKLGDDAYMGDWGSTEFDWDVIEVAVRNVERKHGARGKDRNVEVLEYDSGTDGAQNEDNNEDNIWNSDVDLLSNYSDFEEEARERQPLFHELDLIDPKLEKGMKFTSRALFKDAIHTHAILTKKDLIITKNEVGRMHAKCRGSKKCKWKCHANKVKDEETYYVHSYNPIHSCNETNKVSMLKSRWLSKRYKKKFISYPDISVKSFRDEVTRELYMNFSKQQAYRAKKKVLESIHGDPIEIFHQMDLT